MDLIERFKYLMRINQLSSSAFADEIGVQRSSVSHILSGRNKPSLEFIQKVIKRFPKVDSSWLISGITSTNQEEINPKIEEKSVVEDNNQQIAGAKPQKDSLEIKNEVEKLKAKQIKRVLLFYIDGTFEEFTS